MYRYSGRFINLIIGVAEDDFQLLFWIFSFSFKYFLII